MLDNFLGCCKLRTGCLIIGYCHAIFGFLLLILFGIGVALTVMIEDQLTGDKKATNDMVKGIAVFMCIVCAVNIPPHVILLVGVYQKRPRLLYAYLATMTIYLGMISIGALVVTAINPSRGFSYIFYFALNIYYMMVVQSHREEIRNAPQLTVVFTNASQSIPKN